MLAVIAARPISRLKSPGVCDRSQDTTAPAGYCGFNNTAGAKRNVVQCRANCVRRSIRSTSTGLCAAVLSDSGHCQSCSRTEMIPLNSTDDSCSSDHQTSPVGTIPNGSEYRGRVLSSAAASSVEFHALRGASPSRTDSHALPPRNVFARLSLRE